MSNSEPWYGPVRAIHDDHFHDPWEERLAHINDRFGLQGNDVFLTHGPGLPPPWFNGDIEAVQPGRWVLAISLNPRLNPRSPSAQDWYRDQGFTPDTYWDHWRHFNTNHWYPDFFAPLASLAAGALGMQLADADIPRFATDRMLFVELCPYGSQRFTLPGRAVEELSREEAGFQLAVAVRRILIEQGQPALILVNGKPAVEDLETVDRDRIWLRAISYDSVDKPKEGKKQKRLWHKQGHYVTSDAPIPVIGFPFLRTRMTHNSSAERRQLSGHIQYFLKTQSGRHLNADPG